MTTYPDMLLHLGGVPVQDITQGKVLFVRPYKGSDGYRGNTPSKSVATLTKAKSLATADQNDIVYFMAESNTAAYTTDYYTATLDWSKDGVHLKGVNAGQALSLRSRVALKSTATSAASPLFKLSANGCRIEGMSFFAGVDWTGTAALSGCMLVSGDRNHIKGCHIAGIGHADQDFAGSYSLSVTGSENVFEDCVIGLDTIGRNVGGTKCLADVTFPGGGTGARNVFKRCTFLSWARDTGAGFVNVAATGIDRFALFEDCTFINPIGISPASTMDEAFHIAASTSPAGSIIVRNCTLFGATQWEATAGATGRLYVDGPVPTGAGTGRALVSA